MPLTYLNNLFCLTLIASICTVELIHVPAGGLSGHIEDIIMLTLFVGIIALALLPLAIKTIYIATNATWSFLTQPGSGIYWVILLILSTPLLLQ